MLELRNSFWLALNYLNKLFSSVVFFSILAKIVSVEFFGELTYILSVLAILVVLSSFGLNNYIYIKISTGKFDVNNLIAQSFKIQFTASFFVFLFSMLFYFFNRESNASLLILSVSLFFKPMDILKVVFDSDFKSKLYFKYDLLISTLFILVKLVVVYGNPSSLEFLLLVYVAETIAFSLVYFFLYRKNKPHLGLFLHSGSNTYRIKELLVGALPVLIASCVFMVYSRVDQFMIYNLLGAKEQAYYVSALKISEGWYFVFSAIITSFFSTISKLFYDDKVKYLRKLSELSFFCNLVCYFAVFIVFFSADYLIDFVYGAEYEPAVPVLQIMIFQSLVISSSFIAYRVLLLEGLQKLSVYRALIGLLLNVSLNYILIPSYGIVGAAYSTLFSHFCALFLSNAIFKKTRYLFFLQVKSFFYNVNCMAVLFSLVRRIRK